MSPLQSIGSVFSFSRTSIDESQTKQTSASQSTDKQLAAQSLSQTSISFSSSQTQVSLSSAGLSLSYQESQFSYSQTVTTASRVSPAENLRQSPEQTADNILAFVDQRLESLAVQGASSEELEETLNQGLEGFVKGRDEAIDILKGYGFYNDTLEAGIAETTQRVEDGIDALREKYLPSEAPSDAVEEPAAPVVDEPSDQVAQAPANNSGSGNQGSPAVSSYVETQSSRFESRLESLQSRFSAPSFDSPRQSLGASINSYRSEYQREESLSFSLTTRDGDTVQISLANALNARFGYDSASAGGASIESYAGRISGGSDFLLQVDGDLDEGELEAINNLVAQVDELAQSFFAGDFDQAFAYAQEIGFDSSELASFSLDLSLSETQVTQASSVQTNAYRDQAAQGASLEPLRQSFAPFGELLSNFNAGEPLAKFNIDELVKPIFAASELEQERQGKAGFNQPQQDFLDNLLNKGQLRQLLSSE